MAPETRQSQSSDDINRIIDTALNKFTASEKYVKLIKKAVAEIFETTVKPLIESKLNDCIRELSDISQQVSELKQENVTLRSKLDRIEKQQKIRNLRITGVTEGNKEKSADIAHNLIREKLNLDIKKEDIENAHRTGKRSGTRNRTLLITLRTVDIKNKIFYNKRNLKQSGIVISEDLTSSTLELLNIAKEKYGVRNVWTKNGLLYIKQENQIKLAQSADDI